MTHRHEHNYIAPARLISGVRVGPQDTGLPCPGAPQTDCAHPLHRLEYLRGELRAERISYGELIELQNLASEIAPGDVELLEAAGVPEFDEKRMS